MSRVLILDKGFIEVVENSLSDTSVLRAARVSFGGGLSEDPERDKKLIKYLIDNDHGTPFEHNSITFHVKCPIFVMRQWIRHRIGQSFNEISARYTEMKDEFYIPTTWRVQDKKNKQGSTAGEVNHKAATSFLKVASEEAYERYKCLIEMGVAREMARMILPVNLYTEFYWTVNARSLMAFIRLRSDSHAQYEIRQYSNELAGMLGIYMPWTYEAFIYTLDRERYEITRGLPL